MIICPFTEWLLKELECINTRDEEGEDLEAEETE